MVTAPELQMTLTANEFSLWRDCVRERCGLDITSTRRHFLESRIRERIKQLGMAYFTEYYNYLQYNEKADEEWAHLHDLLLNHESSFFRHQPSFAALRNHALPELVDFKVESGDRRLRMWSAGCAGGQEIYSIGMMLAECGFVPEFRTQVDVPGQRDDAWGIQLLATDAGRRILKQTKFATYWQHELRGLNDGHRRRYLDAMPGDAWQVRAGLRNLVHVMRHDLLNSDTAWMPPQDVIFCQNVLIYFQQQERVRVVDQLCSQLAPRGFLFLGPAELLGYRPAGMRLVPLRDCLVYQRM